MADKKAACELRSWMEKKWRFLLKWAHVIFLVMVVLSLVLEHRFGVGDYLLWPTAFLGFGLWIHVVWINLWHPVRFDQFMSDTRKRKLFRVAALVVAVPVVITTVIMLCSSCLGWVVHSEDMIYADELYLQRDGGSDICPYDRKNALELHRDCFGDTCSQKNPSLLWTVIYHFTDPGNQHMTASSTARGWAFIIGMLGVVFMSGLLVTTLLNWIDQRSSDYEAGHIRYKNRMYKAFLPTKFTTRKRRVVIFIGSHPILLHAIKKLSADVEYIVILTSADVKDLKEKLLSAFDNELNERIIIHSGRITDRRQLAELPLFAAQAVYLIGEKDDPNHDVANIECMNYLEECRDESIEGHIPCHIIFENQSTFSALQSSDKKAVHGKFEFMPYNYYELWAQSVILGDTMDGVKYTPIDGKTPLTEQDDEHVHLFVVGMSKMGVAMASEVAALAHYPNFKNIDGSKERKNRTRITFLDKNMGEEMQYFMSRYKVMFQISKWRYIKGNRSPLKHQDYFGAQDIDDAKHPWNNFIEQEGSTFNHLVKDDADTNFIDIEWQFINGGVEDAFIQNYLRAESRRSRLTVAMCFPDDVESSAAALYLPEEVLMNATNVLVYQKGGKELLDRFAQSCDKLNNVYSNLKPFGMLGACDIQMPCLAIAKILNATYNVHEEMTRYKKADPKDPDPNPAPLGTNVYDELTRRLEDYGPAFVEKKWNELRMWERWSNIYSAMSIFVKLRSMGLSLNEDEAELKRKLGVGNIQLVDLNETDSTHYRYALDKAAPYYTIAVVEHNRWNIEKLLMGFRPKLQHETGNKEGLKANFVHTNICSFEHLYTIEPKVIDIDVAFIAVIPYIARKLYKNKPTENAQ